VNVLIIKAIDYTNLSQNANVVDFLSTSWHFELLCLIALNLDLITIPLALVLFRQRCRLGLLSFITALLAVPTPFFFMFVSEGFAFTLLFLLIIASVVLGFIGWLKNDGRVLALLGILISVCVAIT
jgi:hypothetical protein